MAFKMNGWSAFTKGDGPLYKKEVKKDGEEAPYPKLKDRSPHTYTGPEVVVTPEMEAERDRAKSNIEMEREYPNLGVEGTYVESPEAIMDRETRENIALQDKPAPRLEQDMFIEDPLADDDGIMEEEEEVTPELPVKDVDDVEKEAMIKESGPVSKFPEFTDEVKDKGRWRQRRQRRKELRDAGMSRKEARIQAREDIGKKWGKHKA